MSDFFTMAQPTVCRLSEQLVKRGAWCATAESCTGGLIGALLTHVPSSAWYKGGVIAYDNSIKTGVLGVQEATLSTHGAVSHETVRHMAYGVCTLFHADIAVAVSGIAGPDGGTAEKPVGTVYIGLACQGATESRHYVFSGNREAVRQSTALEAVRLMVDLLEKDVVSGPAKQSIPSDRTSSCFRT